MKDIDENAKRAVLAYLNLQYAIKRKLGLSVKDAKAKAMADFKKKLQEIQRK